MRVVGLRVRALAALLLLLVAGSTSLAGPCSMRMPAAEDSVAHACCATGLTASPPPCCHAQPATPAAAILAGRAAPLAVPAIPFVAPWTAEVMAATVLHAPATSPFHGRPPTVLRI